MYLYLESQRIQEMPTILILKIRLATTTKKDPKAVALFQYSKAVLNPWELQ